VIDLKNLGLLMLERIFIPFSLYCHVLILKKMYGLAGSHLTVTLQMSVSHTTAQQR
jgi:hypothetical protein